MTKTEINEAVDDLVDAWHEGAAPDMPLREYLGMSELEYARWARDCIYPEGYMPPSRLESRPPDDFTRPMAAVLLAIMAIMAITAIRLVVALALHFARGGHP